MGRQRVPSAYRLHHTASKANPEKTSQFVGHRRLVHVKEGIDRPPRDDVPRMNEVRFTGGGVGFHVSFHGVKRVTVSVVARITVHDAVPTQGGHADVLEGLMVASSGGGFVNGHGVFVVVLPQRRFSAGLPFGSPPLHLVGEVKGVRTDPFGQMVHPRLVNHVTGTVGAQVDGERVIAGVIDASHVQIEVVADGDARRHVPREGTRAPQTLFFGGPQAEHHGAAGVKVSQNARRGQHHACSS